jgi:hypothetical protein
MTLSEVEPAIIRLVAQRLNELRYRAPQDEALSDVNSCLNSVKNFGKNQYVITNIRTG